MSKKLQVDRDVNSFPNPDDAKFFGEVCKDIIKNEDGSGYHFEKSAWIENDRLKSYHSMNDFFMNDTQLHDCSLCRHSSSAGEGLLGRKYNCEIASELHREEPEVIEYCKKNNLRPTQLSVPCHWIIKCDAHEEVHELTFIRNMKEMIDFMYATFNMLDGWDGVCAYYGFEIPYDWDNNEPLCTIYDYYENGGKFENVPTEEEFPCVIYFDYNTNYMHDNLKWLCVKNYSTIPD